MKKIEIQCAACCEIVTITDMGFNWSLCDECSNEYEEQLIKESNDWWDSNDE